MVYVYFVYSGFCPVAHYKGVVSFRGLAGFQRYETIVELCWLAVFIQKVISGDAHVLLINYNCQDFILFKSEVISINSQVYQYCTFVNGFSPHLFFLIHFTLCFIFYIICFWQQLHPLSFESSSLGLLSHYLFIFQFQRWMPLGFFWQLLSLVVGHFQHSLV